MAAFDPASPPAQVPRHHVTNALWDTGATRSVISSNVVKDLGLLPVGKCNVNHAGGFSESCTYMVNVKLPNKVGIAGILATEMENPTGFDVIVGMDIISRGDFALTHAGKKTCVSFRIPSCEAIDYVQQAKDLKTAKTIPVKSEKAVGRNASCPCGKKQPNGKTIKYKNCHGA